MTRLHVLREGRGPALLLLHGIGSSATAWSAQMRLLGDAFACIAPDLPGYGESPDPAEGDARGASDGAASNPRAHGSTGSGLEAIDGADPGLAAIVDDVAGVLDGEPAHVVGVSFGALTALALARTRPALVRSLVLADATLGRRMLADDERARWLAHREALAGDLQARSAERAAEIAGRRAPPAVIAEIAAHMRRARPAGYLAVARAIAATDARPWLRDIAQPALILCGEDDRVTGVDVSRTLAENLPQAALHVIAGAGHAPHVEQPGRFADALRAFLRDR